MRLLVGYDASLEIPDKKGNTAIMLATRLRDSEAGEGNREETEEIVRVLER